ncbi:MAG: bifunctional UDP-sugar hydrolase/5'-nucleotidase, partial [Raoultibacter sp.]
MRYSASKKFMSFIITFALACSLATAPLIGWASERDGDAASTHEQNIAAQIETGEDTSAAPLNAVASDTPIAIIHTNDVHCDINESSATLGYAGLATQVKHAQALYGTENVALVDAGDSVQGKPVGTLSKGEDIIDIMNESGYSAATLGNHEFDYGMAQLSKLTSKAAFPYVSCNFISLATGKPVYDPYVIRTYGNTKIAYVGITTPESLTKSTPTNFQDENGNYLYGFCQDETGQALHECIQDAVDSARANGADYVVALGHLGKSDGTSAPDRWNSDAVIAETSGIDAFIDGHSHQVYNQLIKNKDGIEVPLMQTGTQLQASGMIVIDPATDTITTTINTPPVEQDAEMAAYLKVINDRLAQTLDVVIATSQVNLKAIDYDELGQWQAWAVRMRETNLGDLIADSYRSALKADIGFANGGGIRADIATGDVTYGDVISVEPYANTLSMARASGQTILDALEMSARAYPSTTGGFLQTSGLTYELRQDIPSPVVLDSVGTFAGINGDRRVQNVRVAGEPLDP